jgi:outer membrane protein OmpU
MSNLLLGASAIAIAIASPISAANWDARVGGFGEYLVGYSNSSVENLGGEDFDGIDVKQDFEIIFLPSITLDNSLKIGANIQLEGNSDTDSIDESFLFIRGNFGEVLLGSENSAGYLMHYEAPNVLILNPRDLGDFIAYSGDVGVMETRTATPRSTLTIARYLRCGCELR